MKAGEVKIGDVVVIGHYGIPMTVVGIFSSRYDLDDCDLYLDFEGNEGDVWEANIKEVELWRG